MTTPPLVMIDGMNLGLEKGTGVATYGRNLSHALHALGFEVGALYGQWSPETGDPLLREALFFDSRVPGRRGVRSGVGDAAALLRAALRGFRAEEVPVTGRVVRDGHRERLPYFDRLENGCGLFQRANRLFALRRRLTEVRLRRPPAVMHWTYPIPLRVPGTVNFYTIHDLIPLRLPYTTLDNKRRYLRLLREIVRCGDAIVTVSECSRRDIIELLDAPPEKVINTYQAVTIPRRFATKPAAALTAELQGAFGLEYRGYFLFFGAIEPKKNVGRLVEAYLASGSHTPLVVVGNPAWKSDDEMRLLKSHGAFREGGGPRVRHLEYLPFSMLVSLIRGARATLFPSLYEGFGLPVLESMALGSPVLTSTVSSLPEVAGDAALLVDPYDADAVAEAIRRLDGDAALRESLARAGRIQAERFDAAAYERRLAALYGRFGLASAGGNP